MPTRRGENRSLAPAFAWLQVGIVVGVAVAIPAGVYFLMKSAPVKRWREQRQRAKEAQALAQTQAKQAQERAAKVRSCRPAALPTTSTPHTAFDRTNP